MKRVYLIMMAVMLTMAAYAQFEAGKYYVGASVSGLSLSYNGSEKASFGLQAKGGYLFDDNLMATAQLGIDKKNDMPTYFKAGVGMRYYIVQNGLYLGGHLNYVHAGNAFDDFQPGIQVGYAFFLSKTVTVEPEVYYDQSFKSHRDFSTVGIRLGVGVYL